jgi:hypothetical protein
MLNFPTSRAGQWGEIKRRRPQINHQKPYQLSQFKGSMYFTQRIEVLEN